MPPDRPHVIRPLKDSFMQLRSQMPLDVKMRTHLLYLPEWPFVELRTEGQPPQKPDKTLHDITCTILGINQVLPQ